MIPSYGTRAFVVSALAVLLCSVHGAPQYETPAGDSATSPKPSSSHEAPAADDGPAEAAPSDSTQPESEVPAGSESVSQRQV